MGGLIRTRAVAVALYLVLIVAAVAGSWAYSYRAALEQVATRAEADLTLATNFLTAQLERYAALAVLLSDYDAFLELVTEEGNAMAAAAQLRGVADMSGALDVLVLDAAGRLRASASEMPDAGHGDRGYFERALDGALGLGQVVTPDNARVFVYAHPIFRDEGPVTGAIVVVADVAAIEAPWRANASAVFFTDTQGRVFVANRSELVLKQRDQDLGLFDTSGYYVGTREIWTLDAGPYLPDRSLHLTQSVPRLGLTGEILRDIAPARRLAFLQAGAVGAAMLVLGAILLAAGERRRSLADRLRLEAEANAALEARVRARTRELSDVNVDLRREIAEREEAEAQLTRAQAELVQAGKLSALGQMSAGISHELNQPLMAIRSFAENGALLLERGKTDSVGENLDRISELARRMGRIIKNLRAFARQEAEPHGQVDIIGVIEAVLEISRGRMDSTGATLSWTPPAHAVAVMGGEVRLQQVVLNLVTNAIDAMEAVEVKQLEIAVAQTEGRVAVSVADTGPGIAEPDRIFDPFYTTKEVGRSEGMGLGLSISYGMVQSFGGAIRGENRPEGGAMFVLELAAADLEAAA